VNRQADLGGIFLGAHQALVAIASHYDKENLAVVGGGCNPARSDSDLLELGCAAEPHAFLLAEEISPSVAINRRINMP
jgi:hypothetical protein